MATIPPADDVEATELGRARLANPAFSWSPHTCW